MVLGKAKVISYEDLKQAQEKRAARDAAAAKPKRGRKRKSVAESDEDDPEAELKAKVARMSEALELKASEARMGKAQEYRTPEARMSEAQVDDKVLQPGSALRETRAGRDLLLYSRGLVFVVLSAQWSYRQSIEIQ